MAKSRRPQIKIFTKNFEVLKDFTVFTKSSEKNLNTSLNLLNVYIILGSLIESMEI